MKQRVNASFLLAKFRGVQALTPLSGILYSVLHVRDSDKTAYIVQLKLHSVLY